MCAVHSGNAGVSASAVAVHRLQSVINAKIQSSTGGLRPPPDDFKSWFLEVIEHVQFVGGS